MSNLFTVDMAGLNVKVLLAVKKYKIKVKTEDMIAWRSFNIIYLKIGTLCLLVNEYTWNITHIPLKEVKKLSNIILMTKEVCDILIALQPFVISKMPKIKAFIMLLLKSVLNKVIFSIIPIKTENITINPKTKIQVSIDASTLFFNTSPKFNGE